MTLQNILDLITPYITNPNQDELVSFSVGQLINMAAAIEDHLNGANKLPPSGDHPSIEIISTPVGSRYKTTDTLNTKLFMQETQLDLMVKWPNNSFTFSVPAQVLIFYNEDTRQWENYKGLDVPTVTFHDAPIEYELTCIIRDVVSIAPCCDNTWRRNVYFNVNEVMRPDVDVTRYTLVTANHKHGWLAEVHLSDHVGQDQPTASLVDIYPEVKHRRSQKMIAALLQSQPELNLTTLL